MRSLARNGGLWVPLTKDCMDWEEERRPTQKKKKSSCGEERASDSGDKAVSCAGKWSYNWRSRALKTQSIECGHIPKVKMMVGSCRHKKWRDIGHEERKEKWTKTHVLLGQSSGSHQKDGRNPGGESALESLLHRLLVPSPFRTPSPSLRLVPLMVLSSL